MPRYESVAAETCSVDPYRIEIAGPAARHEPPPEPPPPPPPRVAPGPRRPAPIPCALGCPNGVLDSRTCTCKNLSPNAP